MSITPFQTIGMVEGCSWPYDAQLSDYSSGPKGTSAIQCSTGGLWSGTCTCTLPVPARLIFSMFLFFLPSPPQTLLHRHLHFPYTEGLKITFIRLGNCSDTVDLAYRHQLTTTNCDFGRTHDL
jgi:hypothetical protein